MRTNQTLTALAIIGLGTLLFACSVSQSSRTVTPAPPATQSSTEMRSDGTMMRSDGTVRPVLTDANILAILDSANSSAVEDGKLAQQRATNPEVRLYAGRVAQEHQDMLERGSNLASRMNITPSMPPRGPNLATEHQATMQTLKAKSGDAFDRAYLEQEVQTHEDVLKKLDEAFMDARSPELKSYLTQARADVQTHLKKAYDLRRGLMAGGGTETMGTPSSRIPH